MNTKKRFKIISLDWDNVIYNLEQVNLDFVKEVYGVSEESVNIKTWSCYVDKYPEITSVWGDFSKYSRGELIPGAINFVKELKNRGYIVQIITHSYESIIAEKELWMKINFPDIKIIHAKDKFLYSQNSILIDDAQHNVEQHLEYNKIKGESILFDYNGNYGWAKGYKGHKAQSYEKALSIIEKINK